LYWEFDEKFLPTHRHAFDTHAGLVDVALIKDANHVLTFREWQVDMLRRLNAWLERRFPAARGRRKGSDPVATAWSV
jgi:uncharacterized protein YigA (DUF484 family)